MRAERASVNKPTALSVDAEGSLQAGRYTADC